MVPSVADPPHRSAPLDRAPPRPPRPTPAALPWRYTREDIRLLARVDALRGTLAGPAIRKLCERAYTVFHDPRFERLAGISNGLELTRFRGLLILWGGGIHYAEIETAVPAGLPAPDGLRVALARTGRTPEGLAREFEPSVQMIRNRVAQADRDAGRHADGLSTAERGEIRQLRRENRRLREERAMLAKATAWPAARACHLPACPGASGGWWHHLAWTTIDDLAGHDLLA